jgi:hypothetical protein
MAWCLIDEAKGYIYFYYFNHHWYIIIIITVLHVFFHCLVFNFHSTSSSRLILNLVTCAVGVRCYRPFAVGKRLYKATELLLL